MQRLIGSLQQMMHVLNSNGYIRHYHVNITLLIRSFYILYIQKAT